MRAVVRFLKEILLGWLGRLEKFEHKSPRAHGEPWYRAEFHLPPLGVGIVSALLLYATTFFGAELSFLQGAALALFVMIVFVLFVIYLSRDQKELVKSDDAMSLLAVLFLSSLLAIEGIAYLTPYFQKYKWLAWINHYATPVAMAPMLATLLLNPRLAMVLSFMLAMIFGILIDFSLSLSLIGAIGGATAVATVFQARSAHHVARAGIVTGAVQLLVVLFIAIFRDWDRWTAFSSMASAFAGGVVTAVVSLGVLPFLESFFSRISNLRLVELAAVNHPLLQRMSLEAPGTYHHSLIVATLAEDAGNAIGANGLLCRVGAYFHDIGKMVKAEYFIENQGALGNPHDQVAPSLSKLIITSHVKEGLALAKEHKLDPQVAAFIPQHHGTSKIEYFYHKAVQLENAEEEEEKEDVQEEAYRYPGPKPQSKEAGIVMMADSVEATSRSLEDPNHQRYKDMVHKIINKKLSDGQFDETPLTLRDLRIIADRFVATLMSLHHSRIPYPETERQEKKDSPDDALPLQ